MLVAPCRNFAVRKSDKHAKTPSSFANTKFYSLLHFLVVVGEKETAYENWIEHVSNLKRNKMSRGEIEQRKTEFSFTFSLVVLRCLFAGFLSIATRLVQDRFFGTHPKMEAATFGCLHVAVSRLQIRFYLITSGRQLTSFMFSIPRSLLRPFPSESLFSQTELIVDSRLIRFYF